MSVDPPEFEAMQATRNLRVSFHAFHAAMTAARQSGIAELLPPKANDAIVREGIVRNLNGDPVIRYHLEAFVDEAAKVPEDEWSRVFFTGAFVTLGDVLARHDYYDGAPILEFVRHLRNAVGHGNRFTIIGDRWRRHPAHTRDFGLADPSGKPFEITDGLDGKPCLFEFLGPAECLSILEYVDRHMMQTHGERIGTRTRGDRS